MKKLTYIFMILSIWLVDPSFGFANDRICKLFKLNYPANLTQDGTYVFEVYGKYQSRH